MGGFWPRRDQDAPRTRSGARTPGIGRGPTGRLALALALALPSIGAARTAEANPLGVPESRHLRFYQPTSWRLEDGLPQNTVTSIAQGSDGYLWLGTFGGLARFDGHRFVVWDPTSGLPNPRVLNVARGDRGGLWLGHERSGITRFDPGTGLARAVQMPDWLRHSSISQVHAEGDRIWVASGRPSATWDGEAWRSLRPDARLWTIARSPKGDLWVGGERFLGTTSSVAGSRSVKADQLIYGLSFDATGRLWVAHSLGLDVLVDGALQPRLRVSDETWPVAGPLLARDGAIWMAMGDTLYRHRSAEELASSDDLAANRDAASLFPVTADVRTLFEDSDQSVWIGTSGEGLWRLAPAPFDRVGRREGLVERSVGPVVSDGSGGLWVGNGCSGAARLVGERVAERAFGEACLSALALDPSGTLWGGATELLERDGRGRTRVHSPPSDCGAVSAMTVTHAGRLWVGTHRGCVLMMGDHGLERVESPAASRINLVSQASDGSLWFAEDGRVVVRRASGWTQIGPREGLPPGPVRALFIDGDDAWFGTYGGGVTHLREGSAKTFTKQQGLHDNYVSHILDDGRGFMWFNSNRGAFRIPKRDFDELRAGTRRHLQSRPLATGEAEGGTPSAYFDGRHIFLPTIDGLATVDLDRVWRQPPPPATTIEEASLDDVPITAPGVTIAPAGSQRFEATFTAPLLRNPQLAFFEYRLQGLEDRWHRTRRRNVSFDRLGPGRYTFMVRAVTSSEQLGAVSTRSFVIEPHLYETALFRAAVALLVVLVVFGSHRWRTRSISRTNRRLEAEVAQRQAAERALRAGEAHYRRVFESSVNAFILEDPEGRVVDSNPAATEMFGYEREALLGRATSELFDPTEAPTHPDCIICLRRDGSRFEGRLTRKSIPNSDSSQVLLTVTDLSQLVEARQQEHRLQAQLEHSQRVEAIGRLAGGVAHDMNNMLTVVKGQARLAEDALAEGDHVAVKESLRDILESSERTGNLTRQLLALGRRGSVTPVDVDLRTHLAGMKRMLERLTPDNVVLRWSWHAAPCVAHIDPTQLEQLVVNLVLNAVQALPRGGTVQIGLEVVSGQPPHLPAGALGEGDWVDLSIEDDGAGMSEEIRARVFEPFFSTKPQGENTGLGLSVVHGIVSAAGGRYFLESNEGRGTRFDFIFPARPAVLPRTGAKSDGFGSLAGSERIIYCEDEAPVRRIAGRVLERAGYDVTVCAHPFEVLERVRASSQPFALLLTDVMMPDMNGRELAEAVREQWPQQKVLFVSGYTSDLMHDLDDRQDFLEKPFEARELLAATRYLLDA